MLAPGGSYAEYAVAHQHTTFHIPQETSFEGTGSTGNGLFPSPPLPSPAATTE